MVPLGDANVVERGERNVGDRRVGERMDGDLKMEETADPGWQDPTDFDGIGDRWERALGYLFRTFSLLTALSSSSSRRDSLSSSMFRSSR